MVSGSLVKSPHYDFYKQQVDKAIRDCRMWNDKVRLIVYTTIITETCDGRPFGWLNYTNPREPSFYNYHPNDGDPPSKSWSTQRSGGLFQQQPQFWGPDVMDPYKAATGFLVGFKFPNGSSAAGLNKYDWQNMPIHEACQKVQGSEFSAGDNYKRNIQYAQIVLDSGSTPTEDNFWKGWYPMTYTDPDSYFNDPSKVPMGGMPGTESVIGSLAGTNRGIYQFVPNWINVSKDAVIGALIPEIRQVCNDSVNALLAYRFAFGNQDGIPDDQKNTDNIISSINASNQQIFSPVNGLGKIMQTLTDLTLKVDALQASVNQLLPKPPS